VPRRGLRLDRTLGPLVVEWIETRLVHGPGDVQGQPIELDDEQVAFLLRAYEIDDRGRRVVRRAVFSRPKGRAKSEFLGMVVCAEALGPVRFAGWDHDGRPLGHPVQSPYIPIAATEEDQAGDTYGNVEFMLRHGPVAAEFALDVGLTRTHIPGGGIIRPITARASSKEGGKETFAGFDETHLYVTAELRSFHATIRRNLAKRRAAEPWSMETTTMYAPGEESVAESSHGYAEAIRSGAVNDPSFLFDHREAPRDFNFDSDDELRAALADVYGEAAEWMDLERLIAEARDPDTKQADFSRYFLNWATARDTDWIDSSLWKDLADPDREVDDAIPVVLFFDGSRRRDSTALVGCTVEEKPHIFVVAAWEKPPKTKTWDVPSDEVNETVRWAMEDGRYNVVELAADPPGWHEEVRTWGERWGEDVKDRDGELWNRVVVYRTNQPTIMGPACEKLGSAAGGREFTHDGDPRLARHVKNAVVKRSHGYEYITKDHPDSPRKIDLAVGAVGAYDRALARRRWLARQRTRSGTSLVSW
jgi:phage terminase large subunit-like protein